LRVAGLAARVATCLSRVHGPAPGGIQHDDILVERATKCIVIGVMGHQLAAAAAAAPARVVLRVEQELDVVAQVIYTIVVDLHGVQRTKALHERERHPPRARRPVRHGKGQHTSRARAPTTISCSCSSCPVSWVRAGAALPEAGSGHGAEMRRVVGDRLVRDRVGGDRVDAQLVPARVPSTSTP